jgi:hypothetical protein
MYTVERADQLSVKSGSGEFIAVIDFEGVTLGHMPPLKVIKTAINLLKLHYPYRLGGIFVLNAGISFNMTWRMIRPLLPKLALSKTHIVSGKNRAKIISTHIGENFIETSYGGRKLEVTDVAAYLSES